MACLRVVGVPLPKQPVQLRRGLADLRVPVWLRIAPPGAFFLGTRKERITARSSSDGGIVRPSALAFLG